MNSAPTMNWCWLIESATEWIRPTGRRRAGLDAHAINEFGAQWRSNFTESTMEL